jgi:hypothetical protein
MTAGLLKMGLFLRVLLPDGGAVRYGGTSCRIVPDSGTVTNSVTISDNGTAL